MENGITKFAIESGQVDRIVLKYNSLVPMNYLS